VEAWECDFNGHWNARFYGEAFSEASDVVAAIGGGEQISGPAMWHIRFHSELMSGAAVEVRSSRAPIDTESPPVLHALSGAEHLSATALQWSRQSALQLPMAHQDELQVALPRGVTSHVQDWADVVASAQQVAQVGIVRRTDLDASGRLTLKAMLRLCGRSSHHFTTTLGFSTPQEDGSGIGRMLVELRATLFDTCLPDEPAVMYSRLTQASTKSFVVSNLLKGSSGGELARIELCLVAVDLDTRRACAVPEFVRRAITVAT
jgi:acyl-CoA thioesterase FadM